MNARAATSILGIWLFMSVFAWHHQPERGFNDIFVGLLLFSSGFFGTYIRSFRYFDGVLGCWMLLSFFVLMSNSFAERLHDGVLGLLIVGLATVGGRDGERFYDHWVRLFDRNPALDRGPIHEG